MREQLAALQREKRISDALVRVAEEAGETLAFRDVLERICRLTAELTPCDNCTIYIFSERRRAYIPIAGCGMPEHVAAYFIENHFFSGKMFFEDELTAGRAVVLSRDANPSA